MVAVDERGRIMYFAPYISCCDTIYVALLLKGFFLPADERFLLFDFATTGGREQEPSLYTTYE